MDEHHGQGKVRSWNAKEKEQKKNVSALGKVPLFGDPEVTHSRFPSAQGKPTAGECQGPLYTRERTPGHRSNL